MDQPDLVASRLGEEDVVATVNLSGEDALVITPSRSLLYRGEGILSDESVTEYPHDVERITASAGRRKTTIELEYPIEESRTMSVPKASVDSVLHYLLAGMLNAKDITDPGESVQGVYRFNELTVIITDKRIVMNVGESVWDEEFDEYRYRDLTGLEFEEGRVATQVVLYIDGRSQRIKAPKGRGEAFKQDLREAIFAFYDVSDMATLQATLGTVGGEEPATETTSAIAFDEAVEPLGAGSAQEEEPAEESTETEERAPTEAIPPADLEELEAVIKRLQEAVSEQRDLLEAQQDALDDLVATLTRDR